MCPILVFVQHSKHIRTLDLGNPGSPINLCTCGKQCKHTLISPSPLTTEIPLSPMVFWVTFTPSFSLESVQPVVSLAMAKNWSKIALTSSADVPVVAAMLWLVVCGKTRVSLLTNTQRKDSWCTSRPKVTVEKLVTEAFKQPRLFKPRPHLWYRKSRQNGMFLQKCSPCAITSHQHHVRGSS